MGDYADCEIHNMSYLMPDLLMCPKCAREALKDGGVPEPIGDALEECVKNIEADLAEAVKIMEGVKDSIGVLMEVFPGAIAKGVISGAFIGTEQDIEAFLTKHRSTT